MRINLALQCSQLTSPALVLLGDNLRHQVFNLLIGLLDRISQMPDFV